MIPIKFKKIDHPLMTMVSVLVFVGFLFISIIWFSTERPPEQYGDILDIRGTIQMVIRTPQGTPMEHIGIRSDGSVIRPPVPYHNARDPHTLIHLSAAEHSDLQRFRTQWCQHQIPVRTPEASEPFYDVAVLCGAYDKQQARVPVDMLPTILQVILTRLPALPV